VTPNIIYYVSECARHRMFSSTIMRYLPIYILLYRNIRSIVKISKSIGTRTEKRNGFRDWLCLYNIPTLNVQQANGLWRWLTVCRLVYNVNIIMPRKAHCRRRHLAFAKNLETAILLQRIGSPSIESGGFSTAVGAITLWPFSVLIGLTRRVYKLHRYAYTVRMYNILL
jgi:hypothetical protein